jgi:hypothetical protein
MAMATLVACSWGLTAGVMNSRGWAGLPRSKPKNEAIRPASFLDRALALRVIAARFTIKDKGHLIFAPPPLPLVLQCARNCLFLYAQNTPGVELESGGLMLQYMVAKI